MALLVTNLAMGYESTYSKAYKAYKAYQKGDYTTAIKLYTRAAEQGNYKGC